MPGMTGVSLTGLSVGCFQNVELARKIKKLGRNDRGSRTTTIK